MGRRTRKSMESIEVLRAVPGLSQASRWTVGENCVGFVDRGHSISPQSQVLIANVAQNVRRCSDAVLEENVNLVTDSARNSKHSRATNCAAALLGLAPGTVSRVASLVETKGLQAGRARGRTRKGSGALGRKKTKGGVCKSKLSPADVKHTLIREAIALETSGQSRMSWPAVLCRLQSAGLAIGRSWHSRFFPEAVEVASAACLDSNLGAYLAEEVPSLGVRSCFQIIFDGGTIGKAFRSSRDPLLLCGLLKSDAATGRIRDIFLDAPSHGIDGSNPATFQLVMSVLRSLRPPIDESVIRAFGACSGTDGAYTRGGPLARHDPGDGVCQRIWRSARREDRSVWDDFHRQDKSGARANALPAAQRFFTLTKFMEKLFGFGQGKALDRAISRRRSRVHLTTRTACNTRKIVYISRVPRRFLDKYRSFYLALLVRRSAARSGRGSFTKSQIEAIGHQMASIDMIAFVSVIASVSEHDIEPMALTTQGVQTLPWVKWRAARRAERKMEERQAELQAFRETLLVLLLLRAYMPEKEWVAFYRCVVVAWHWRALPLLVQCTYELLAQRKFQGCNAMVTPPVIPGRYPGEYKLCHPACQCAYRNARCLPSGPIPLGQKEHKRQPQPSSEANMVLLHARDGAAGRVLALKVPAWTCVPPTAVNRPLHFIGAPTLKTHGGHPGCFTVGWRMLEAWRLIDQGVRDAQQWCALHREEFLAYQGDVGVPKFFQEAWADMSDAWWFPNFVPLRTAQVHTIEPNPPIHAQRASALHWFEAQQLCRCVATAAAPEPEVGLKSSKRAFLHLYKALGHDLSCTGWPSSSSFSWVKREWPSARDMLQQYNGFIDAVKRRSARSPGWFKTQSVVVCAWHPIVQALLARTRASTEATALILSYVGGFLAWCLPAGRLSEGDDGSYKRRVARGPVRRRGRLVAALGEVRALDQNAICATLETNKNWVRRNQMWHVVNMLHRSRHLGGNETPGERWTGVLKCFWNPVLGPCTRTIVNRVKLRLAGVRGDGMDEDFVRMVAASFEGDPLAAKSSSTLAQYQRMRQEQMQECGWLRHCGQPRPPAAFNGRAGLSVKC